jgi:glycerophosphoryl diester phosphodiesterase
VGSSRARPLILGHRGARHAAPENTFKAFELALAEGAAGVELDVRLDRSGEVVVIHDPTLERLSVDRRTDAVEALDARELRRVDVGDGERIPRLADVLAWARDKNAYVNVELKADLRDKRRLLDAVVQLLAPERQTAADRLLLSSFNPAFVQRVAARLRPLPACWLVHDEQRVFRFALGWQLLGARGVNPQHTLLSAAGVRRLKRAGALVNTWTVNDPVLAAAYAEFGVDAIISDCPGKLLGALP